VLLAEDNAVNQQLARRVLEKRGHHVTLAVNGRDAVAEWEREPFDLILMDVQMPEMGGLEATAAIRAREDGGRRIPIVAMTARAMKGDREECLAAGMDEYVSKPLSVRVLFKVIETLTAGRVLAGTAAEPARLDELLARFDGDHVLLGELAAIFLQEYPTRIGAARAAAERRDAVALEMAAHELKGSAGNFGAAEAVRTAERLETMGRAGDLTGLDGAFAEFERAMSSLTARLAAVATEVPE
jgi:CheY-like chemotaxis protein/HPt (histidine-containing phosphotransfer) domain-containing protein